MAYQILDYKGNVLREVDAATGDDYIANNETHEDYNYFQWDVDLVERLSELTEEEGAGIAIVKKIEE